MRRTILLIAIGVLLVAVLPARSFADDGELTMNGEFVWTNRSTTGDLEAVFTPVEAGKWEVAFHFTFRDDPHVYKGTAEGSLDDGDLRGEVRNENEQRTFTFEGRVKDGRFEGTHAEVTDGRGGKTGTMMLAH